MSDAPGRWRGAVPSAESAIRRAGRALVDLVPRLEGPAVRAWYAYVYLHVRAVGLWNSLRHEAPVEPFRIYWVDPDRIQRKRPSYPGPKYRYFGRVADGDWDRQLEPFEETTVYRSFEAHFRRGVDWEDTQLFRDVVEEIAAGNPLWECESEAEFRSRCEALDDLYRRIRAEGYRTQRELAAAEGEALDKGRHSIVHRLVTDEMSVSVARDGEVIFNDGRNRLAIAKLLDLDEVPVRIMVRHARWQTVRDAVATGEVDRRELPEHLRTHPDLRGLGPGNGSDPDRRTESAEQSG